LAEQVLDLAKAVRTVRRSKLLVGGIAAVGLLGGAAFAVVSPPKYTSTAQVVLPAAVAGGESAAAGTGNGTDSGDYMATQVVVAGSDPVLSLALREARTAPSVQVLRREIEVSSPSIGIVSITATGRSASQAEKSANAVANSYVSYVSSAGSLVGRAAAHVINAATFATAAKPAKRIALDALLGGGCFALIAIIVALAMSRGSRRLRTRDEIANSIGLPVIASLPTSHPADAAGWTQLLDEYRPPPIYAWQLRSALRALGVLKPGVNTQSSAGGGGNSSLAVVSLASDHRACALGPQLAVFAASLGIPTALVIGPQGDTTAMVTLRTACAVPPSGSSRRPRHLYVLDSDSAAEHDRPDARLTVVVAVVDEQAPTFPDAMRTAMTVLGVSAGLPTADQLAHIAVAATAEGRDVVGIIVADPEPTDRTTGRSAQVMRVGKISAARPPEPAASHARAGYWQQMVSEPTRPSRSVPEQGGRRIGRYPESDDQKSI
jgi:capsular polysaccharide biosynthesis protein